MADGEVALPGPVGVVGPGLRLVARAIRAQPRPFLVSAAGALLYGGMTVAAAAVIGRVTDAVVIPALRTGVLDAAALTAAAAAIIGVALLKALGIVGRRVGGSWMQLRLHADTRTALTRRYLTLPITWHRRRATGALLATANADVEAAFSPIAPLPMSLGVLFMLLVTAVALLLADPVLAAVGFVVGPLVGALNAWFNRVTTAPARRAQEQRGALSDVAHESFDGAVIVKALGREKAETARFARASEELRDVQVRLGRIRAVFDPVLELLPQAGVLAVLGVGAARAAAGAVTAGQVVEFSYLFLQVAVPIRVLGYFFSELPRSAAGWTRVGAVLDADDSMRHGNARLPATGPARVDLETVSYLHPGADRAALEGVELSVDSGRIVAVVGPTGSGKSTLASLLLRLADADVGVVRLDGLDVGALARDELPRHAAVVFQDTFLFDDSVRANVALDDHATDADVWAALRDAHVDDVVRALPDGLDTRLGERGATLSGGQRQRIALARALVRQPRLLVLDDATSSVDVAVEQAILSRLRRRAGTSTIVVIAYRRATIALADEVVLLEHGHVRTHGSHAHLLATEPAYDALLNAYDPGRWVV